MATSKDVARLAKVGVGTASRVISGNGSVAKETAERVRKAIDQLEFRPSHAARSLLSGSSKMIGVYLPLLKGTFYTPILQTIDTELRSSGLHMMVAFGVGEGDARQQAREGIEFLIERGCDGLLVFSNALNDTDFDEMGPKRGNLIVLNRHYPSVADQCFTANHHRGGVLAARSLLKLGHKSFAVIGGPSSSPDNVDRLSGFMGELQRNGVDTSCVISIESDFSTKGGWDSAETLMASGRKFTALFCANDEMAVGALSYLQQVGIKVPETISVMGYDNTDSAEYSAPRLTSIHVPWRDITLNGLHWLMNCCYGSHHRVTRDFRISVTWRASVAPPRLTVRKR